MLSRSPCLSPNGYQGLGQACNTAITIYILFLMMVRLEADILYSSFCIRALGISGQTITTGPQF